MVAKKKKTEEGNMKTPIKYGKVEKTVRKAPIPSSLQPRDDSPIRAIVCLKKINDMKRFEETEDCFILGFDPSEPVPLLENKKNPASARNNDDDDLSVIAEKGKVACRDYPHSRHLCLKFPFKTTPHQSYCEMCYCYVCDSAAPCLYWTQHCNAESVSYWKNQRNMRKQQGLLLTGNC
ncbi:RPM1 interacting protein 13-like [Gastrolobium bilobum]|uniref:RPM1 interacting protein 13-like n=1 Tax=Gastrolobium bilobum TaxID=150636 RepID=UPI002AB1A920|nr:RPM1 interacting protein 13-like [Gastrolobium bilobum]